MTIAESFAETCPLLANGKPGECLACGATLTGRQKRWCGRDDCVRFYGRNHWWSMARDAAVRRATVPPEGRPIWTICDQCGRDIRGHWSETLDGRYVSHTDVPEVNHVDPRKGAGYGTGCWNHQTNLQVLCHECHVAETNRQRQARSTTGASPMAIDWAAA